jgi:hypothetical protein
MDSSFFFWGDTVYTFQINRIPTWIPDLIFKYQNTMNVKCILGCIFTWSGSSSYVNNPV